jgi:putative oxidoreductase
MTMQALTTVPTANSTGDNRSSLVWPSRVVPWAAQVIVAGILAQTLFFKFTYAPETRFIFESRGGRPVATIVGLVELVCAVLLLIPRTATLGAALSLAVIGGAIMTHLTSLGIEVKNPNTGEGDGGLLFGLALAVAFGAFVVLAFRWRHLPFLGLLWEWKGSARAS